MDAAAAPSETSSAILESPLIPADPYCFEFYYYMYGDDVGGELIILLLQISLSSPDFLLLCSALVVNSIFCTVLVIVLC